MFDLKLPVVFAYFTCGFLTLGGSATAQTATPSVSNGQSANSNSGALIVVPEGPLSNIFDFGKVSILDSATEIEDELAMLRRENVLPGIKHQFQVRNRSGKPVTITALNSDYFGLDSQIPIGKYKVQSLPKVVAPGESVPIVVAFDKTVVVPGPVEVKIQVATDEKAKVPLDLVMRGVLDSGIQLSGDSSNFGVRFSGEGGTKKLTVILDKRISKFIPDSPMRVISSNPYVKVKNGVLKKGAKVAVVKQDTIRIPWGFKNKDIDDYLVEFDLELSKEAPIGPLGGQVQLVIVGAPMFMLVQDAKVEIKGAVQGHLVCNAPRHFAFGSVQFRKDVEKVVKVTLKKPLLASDLKVLSSSPFVEAVLEPPVGSKVPGKVEADQLVKPQPAPGEIPVHGNTVGQNDKEESDSEVVLLKIGILPTAPVGKLNGKVHLFHPATIERFEFSFSGQILPTRGAGR